MNARAMVLESLTISRCQWDYDSYKKGDLKGTIVLLNNEAKIELALTKEQLQPIIDVVADAMVKQTKAVADGLTREVFTAGNALPPPSHQDIQF